jgi:integrase
MPLYKRDDSPYWWAQININGKTIRRSTKTAKKSQAQEVYDHLNHELWRQGQGLQKLRKWSEARDKFISEKSSHSSIADMVRHLNFWDQHLGHLMIHHITTETISDTPLHFEAATANRYRATLKSLLNSARKDWGWIQSVPVIRMQQETKKRIRWITREEADRLIAALPDYLRGPAEFSLQTGLRQSNALNLQWPQVDLLRKTAWVYGDEAKGKADIAVPLNSTALNVLYGRANRHPTHVFTDRKGSPIKSIDSGTWAGALKAAGLENFKWHDLRHTWASWHVQNGTSLQELMALGGWKSFDMVLRYAHLSSEQLIRTAQNITTHQSSQNALHHADSHASYEYERQT